MSKGKFEILFMGGALVDYAGVRAHRFRLGLRSRGLGSRVSSPRHEIGAAMLTLTAELDRRHDELADGPAAATALARVRTELCEPKPDRAAVTAHLQRFHALTGGEVALADEARRLQDAVERWLS